MSSTACRRVRVLASWLTDLLVWLTLCYVVLGCFCVADNVELKKLVYLYLINYAKTHPTMAIMAVNTFVKDTTHRSPLIRALSVRTMGCIRVEKITEYARSYKCLLLPWLLAQRADIYMQPPRARVCVCPSTGT